MTEVLAIVASGIAVEQAASQLASGLLKTRQLWEQIQNAPERVSDLLADLDVIGALLGDVERQFTSGRLPPTFWNDATARRSSRLCQEAVERLEELCRSLQKHLESPKRSRRMLGAAKVVLKDEALTRYEERLRATLSLLQMSQLYYQT